MNTNINKNEQGSLQIAKKNQSSLLLTSVKSRLTFALFIIICLWLALGQIL